MCSDVRSKHHLRVLRLYIPRPVNALLSQHKSDHVNWRLKYKLIRWMTMLRANTLLQIEMF